MPLYRPNSRCLLLVLSLCILSSVWLLPFLHPPPLFFLYHLKSRQCGDHHDSDDGYGKRLQRKRHFCDYADGEWVLDSSRKPLYSKDCPFQRNAWNCGRNKRPGMDHIFQWRWLPRSCDLLHIDPHQFLSAIRNMKIGFIGDSLNENFLVSTLCTLRTADTGAYKWKKKGAWRGAHFPNFNVTIAYHRAVLLASYHEFLPANIEAKQMGSIAGVRVDVDVPANDWINVTEFYDIFVFNTGHWWSHDKFPPEKPLIFYKEGKPLSPQLGLYDGLTIVLQNMIRFVERAIPAKSLKIWRLQSPRHFEGGEWNQNGSCLRHKPLSDAEVQEWFGLDKVQLNKEARKVNQIITNSLQGSSFYVLNITHMSEYRADAHPALWLGGKDAHVIWGQDCLHWCLPGLPDTWVDMLAAMISEHVEFLRAC